MSTTAKYDYPFDHHEAIAAYKSWGFSCGPAALAFACQVPIASVRHALPDFDKKRHATPTMMAAGLRAVGRQWTEYRFPRVLAGLFAEQIALVRIQWSGPWTAPGANPKWAYRQTHWVASWQDGEPLVFDINSGIVAFEDWKSKTVPELTNSIPRADGDWWPTHVWRLVEKGRTA